MQKGQVARKGVLRRLRISSPVLYVYFKMSGAAFRTFPCVCLPSVPDLPSHRSLPKCDLH